MTTDWKWRRRICDCVFFLFTIFKSILYFSPAMDTTKKLSFSDFAHVCRLCLKFGEFDDYRNLKGDILGTYNHITNVPMKETDLLPKGICEECVGRLEDISNFIESCKYNHFYLLAIAIQEEDERLLDRSILKVEIHDASDSVQEDMKYSGVEEEEEEEVEVKRVKSSKKWNCKKCNKKFRTANMLELHSSKHLGVKPYKCKICNKRFNIKASLKNHKLAYHIPKPFKCSICEWTGSTEALLEEHEVKHSLSYIPKLVLRDKKWKCVTCEKSFRKKNDLHRHLRVHSGIRPFGCTLCPRSFTQKSTLKRHVNAIHVKEERASFDCYICEKKFHRKDHIESHMINCHVSKTNMINYDDGNLESEVMSDTQCRRCGKEFSLNVYLRQHYSYLHHKFKMKKSPKRSSSNKPKNSAADLSSPCLCSICGRFFLRHATFSQHMRRSHGGGTSSQHYSNKNPTTIKSEKSSHKSKQQYQCWLCGKIKSTHCNLKVHMRTHTGEKPYQCKFCYRKFTAWNSWHDHENIHTGVKPYQCELCNKTFRQRSSLRKHLRSSVHSKPRD